LVKGRFRPADEYCSDEGESVKILLVEDSKPIRRANEEALVKAGYEVISAEDGATALQMAREHNPDLVLLDMILPKMSGPEVLQHLKSETKTAEIPVVVVSSLSEKNRDRLVEAGAEDFLEKNLLMPRKGVNLLPKALENVICRINRKRGVSFASVPHLE
jgi:two-component system, cell cycle response regulator DivK